MQELNVEGIRTGLVIVAHPDDETIWMGGVLARYKEIQWTIFVLCRKSDPDRMPKFLKVARYYGAKGIICDLEDDGIMNVAESIPIIEKNIRQELPLPAKGTWDVLFLHGKNGEYGHMRHQGVHQAIKRMVRKRELRAKQIFCFAYTMDTQKKVAVPEENAQYAVELSNAEWKAKRNVIKQLYGFRPHIFENRSCAKTETFSVLGRA